MEDQAWDDYRVSPSKELPTKEQKLQRNRDRQELSFALPVKTWMKTNSFQMLSAADRDARYHPENAVSMLSQEMNGNKNLKYFLPFHYNLPVDSKMDTPPHQQSWKCGYLYGSIPNPPRQDSYSPHVEMDCGIDYDQPLDMSKKSSRREDEYEAKSSSSLVQQQQLQRPSVITCAPSMKDSLPTKYCEQQNVWYGNINCSAVHKDTSDRLNERSTNILLDEARPGHRREIASGMCDPVIEEHFRRSLGKDYTEVFSSSNTSVSITVDDHFAKALGDTWLQLQQTKLPEGHTPKLSSRSRSQSPPVLQPTQEIVSS